MIKNISKKDIVIRWDGHEITLKPGKKLDIRDLNVPHNDVVLVESKIGAKHSGKVEITHTKEELMGRENLRKQQEDLAKREDEVAKREEIVTKREKKLNS